MRSFEIVVLVAADVAHGTTLQNTATVTGQDPDPTPGNNSDTEPTPVQRSADLSIDKIDNGLTATAGQNFTYTIQLTNNGPSDSSGWSVVDTLPTGMTYVSGPADVDITVQSNTPGAGQVTFSSNTDLAASGMRSFEIVVLVAADVAHGTTLQNTATVTGQDPDPDLENNTDTEDTPVLVVTDIQIIKTSGMPSVVPGGPVTYTIVVTNAGPSDAVGARVMDEFSALLIDVNYTSTVTGIVSGNTAVGSGDIDDTVDMAVGSTITYEVTATLSLNATGTLSNVATVTPGPGAEDPNPDDNVDPELILIEKLMVVGPDKGNASKPWIHVVSRDTGELVTRFLAFEESYLGGVRITTGDLTGDGIPEIVAVRGRNSTPDVRIFDLEGNLLKEIQVFPASFNGGVSVAVGDVDGDGRNDLVAGMSYLGSQVVVFRNTTAAPGSALTFEQGKSFAPFGASFIGGVVVAVADMGELQGDAFVANLDDKAEIIVGNEAGMSPTVKVFEYASLRTVRTFYPFNSAFKGGISLDVARVNEDLIPDIIVGTGPTGGSNIEVLDGAIGGKATLLGFTAYSAAETSSYNVPVRVAAVDDDGDGWADVIVTAQGTNGTTGIIKVFGLTAPAQLVGQFPGNLPNPSDFASAYFVSDLRTATPTRPANSDAAAFTPASWTNPILAGDVNADGMVTALDALLVINDLNTFGSRVLSGSPTGTYFPDVDGSGSLEPLDVLRVIQYLASPSRLGGEGEGGADAEILPARAEDGFASPIPDARPETSGFCYVAPLPGDGPEPQATDLVFASLGHGRAMPTSVLNEPSKRTFRAAAGQVSEDWQSLLDWDPDLSAIADDVCQAWQEI